MSSKKDLSAQLKIALILPVLLTIAAGVFGIYKAVDIVGKVVCGVLAVIAAGSIVAVMLILSKRISDKIRWYTDVLDAIPFPISVTDKDMNWTFINKPVEDMIKTRRAEAIGKHCSNWGADICNTEQCGVTCLKKNITETTFEQKGLTFKVDTSFLSNSEGNIS